MRREPLKILVDVRPPKWAGGSFTKDVVEFLKALARLDHQGQYVILADVPAPFTFTTSTWNFSLDVVAFKVGSFSDAFALPFLLKMHRANILHSFSLSIPHFTRHPIILDLSEDEKAIFHLRRGASRRATKILVRDERMKKRVIRHLDAPLRARQEEKIIITPSAVDLLPAYQDIAANFAEL